MPRNWQINVESLVQVKGATDTAIANLTELGLAVEDITVSPHLEHDDMLLDASGRAPSDVQFFMGWCDINMTLGHFDPDVLETCINLSAAQIGAFGSIARAGTRLGNNVARFVAGYRFVGLNITSPVEARPWRFGHTYLTGTPVMVMPLGTKRSLVQLNWRAIAYQPDPYAIVSSATGTVAIWDRTADT